MGWQIRTGVPSDSQLKAYDDRAAAREAEIRRPGRKIDVIDDATYYRMQAQAAKFRQLMKWHQMQIKEVRRRNKVIRYKLFLFFKEHYHLDNVDEALSLKAIAAVCKSITKDFQLYCQLLGMGLGEDDEEVDDVVRESVLELLKKFSKSELAISVDDDDILNIMEATFQKVRRFKTRYDVTTRTSH
jgi:hypothetical protein